MFHGNKQCSPPSLLFPRPPPPRPSDPVLYAPMSELPNPSATLLSTTNTPHITINTTNTPHSSTSSYISHPTTATPVTPG